MEAVRAVWPAHLPLGVRLGVIEFDGQTFLTELRDLGSEAAFVRADVRYENEVAPLIDETIRHFGRLDAAVNNAGIDGKFGPLSGSIVNISSTMAVKGVPNASLYTGSKHAVEGITKSIALEAAPLGIRVNAVAPGPVETEMLHRITGDDAGRQAMIQGVPMKRIGRLQEIVAMIVFVASNKVPFMTGEIVRVNGGKTA